MYFVHLYLHIPSGKCSVHAVYHHLYMRMTNGSSQDGERASNNNVHAGFLFLWDGFSKVCFIPPPLFWNLRFTGLVWVQGFSNWYGELSLLPERMMDFQYIVLQLHLLDLMASEELQHSMYRDLLHLP